MKLAIIVSLVLFGVSRAHMGMSLVGVPAREKAKNGDNYRSPHGTKICQGTPKIGVQKTVAAGATIDGKMSNGAAHGGGHCSMIVSVDEKTWYKIGDYKDCTTKGGLSFKMPKGVPKECSGAAGCTFGWLWTPMLSGTCEIYMNCYQLQVTGAVGGIETAANRKLSLPIGRCVRPNSRTHLTTMFGYVIGSSAPDPASAPAVTTPKPTAKPGDPTPAPVTAPELAPISVAPDTDSPTCEKGQVLLATGLPKTHKVAVANCGYVSEIKDPVKKAQDEKDKCLAANSLSLLSELYDLKCSYKGCKNWDALYNLNKCADKSLTHSCAGGKIPTCMAGTPDQICAGQTLKLPQTMCGATACGAHGKYIKEAQKCYCEPGYTGAQCTFAIGADASAQTVVHGVALLLGVVCSLVF